jgi:adenine deaminase
MVLAKPVVNANGLPIVAAGTILDAAMIERLRQMELTSVYVEGDALDSGGQTLAELEAELDHRFRHVAQDPIQKLILRTLRTHLRATHGVAPVNEKPWTT